ncbi:MAG: translation initiation factor IF-3 [Candidatus Levyibacteriota bacterium]
MSRNFKRRQDNRKFYRTNDRIFAQSLRVLDSENKQIGILTKQEALRLAQEQDLDLVEIAEKAVPPVAKIVDFKKFLYQQEKKRQEEKKKTKTSETKEIRLGPFINDHDLEVVIKRARGFLEDGNKVKLVVRFRGRQITHPEFGQETLRKTLAQLEDLSKIDREMHFEGKQLLCLLSPERKGKNAKEKDQEISEPQI